MQFVVVDNDRQRLLALGEKLKGQFPDCTITAFIDPMLSAKFIYNNHVDAVFVQKVMRRVDGEELRRIIAVNNPDLSVKVFGELSELGELTENVKTRTMTAGFNETRGLPRIKNNLRRNNMNENLKAFMKYVSEHEEVVAKFDVLKEEQDKQKVVGATIAIAKEHGFELTADDFAHEELSEKELGAVAGGGKTCACVFGGGGEAGDGGRTCACVFYGIGHDEDTLEMRCVCPMAGGGN